MTLPQASSTVCRARTVSLYRKPCSRNCHTCTDRQSHPPQNSHPSSPPPPHPHLLISTINLPSFTDPLSHYCTCCTIRLASTTLISPRKKNAADSWGGPRGTSRCGAPPSHPLLPSTLTLYSCPSFLPSLPPLSQHCLSVCLSVCLFVCLSVWLFSFPL